MRTECGAAAAPALLLLLLQLWCLHPVAGQTNECLGGAPANQQTCSAQGQTCSDPDENSANDWVCICSYPQTGQGAQAAATCTPPAAVTNDNCVPSVCGATQACYDATVETASALDDSLCLCVPPYTGTAVGTPATCVLDECTALCPTCATKVESIDGNLCRAGGQICYDPDKSTTGDWVCQCPNDATTSSQGALATCTPAAGNCAADPCGPLQYCYDPFPSVDDDNWECRCLPPARGMGKAAPAAACVLDECVDDCPTCAAGMCGKYGQRCQDPNTAVTSTGDWQCSCAGGAGVTGRPAACRFGDIPAGSCTTQAQFEECQKAGKECSGDTCVCIAPYVTKPGTTDCVLDECLVTGNDCGAGQQCVDPNMESRGDWWCECNAPSQGRAVGGAATCILDECSAICPDCARTSNATENVCSAELQRCEDPNTSPTVTNDWVCKCTGGSVGPDVTGGPADCTVPDDSECIQFGDVCKSAMQACEDTTLQATTDDWMCTCLLPGSTQTGGQQEPAQCVYNECEATKTICESVGQKCVDPNTAESSLNDWFCECQLKSGSGRMQGGPANCDEDECILYGQNCTSAGQQCIDTPGMENWECACPDGYTATAPGTSPQRGKAVVPGCDPDPQCTTTCAANQFCSLPTSGMGPGSCQCLAPFTLEGAACVLNECTAACATCANGLCENSGQDCMDPNTATDSTNDWECRCRQGDGSEVRAVAVCVFDSCGDAAISSVCTDEGQTCYDANNATSSSDDWYCTCPTSSAKKQGAPAVCTVDECVANGQTCWDVGQVCDDPNPSGGSLNDWTCSCVAPATGSERRGVATCTHPMNSECNVDSNEAVCTSVGQTCDDPNTGTTDDWTCKCVPPAVGDAMARGAANCTIPQVDECQDTAKQSVCTGASQVCFDPDKERPDNWGCTCPVGGNLTVGAPVPGGCPTELDECNGVCSTCAGDTCTSASPAQTCDDPSKTTPNDWKCLCPTDTTGEATAAAATCTVDECNVTPSRCGDGQECEDSNKAFDSSDDFVCSCTTSSRQATGAPVMNCGTDECRNAVPPCGTNQECSDPNFDSTGNFVCKCPSTNETNAGGLVSPCDDYEDECSECTPGNVDCPCGDQQTCNDPVKTTLSKFDFTCTCTTPQTNPLRETGGKVLDCGAAPTPLPTNQFLFRYETKMDKSEFSRDKMISAIVEIINGRDEFTTCDGCEVCAEKFVKNLCFEWGTSTCRSLPEYFRAATTQQARSGEGVFEFLGDNNVARQQWVAALRAQEQRLQDSPAVQMVQGSFTADTTVTPAPPPPEDDGGLDWWVWLLIALAICCLIIIIVLIIMRMRGRKKQEENGNKGDEEDQVKGDEMHAVGTVQQQNSVENAKSDDALMRNSVPSAAAAAGGAGAGAGAGAAMQSSSSMSSHHRGPLNQEPARENPIAQFFPPAAATGAFHPSSKHRDVPKETVVIGFGRNLEGQLGIGEAEEFKVQYQPVEVPNLNGLGVHILASGSFHTIVVTTDATVLAFGEGSDGQLGLSNRMSPKVPTPVPFFRGKVPRIVACGEQHTVIACTDNVYAFGSGQDGQLGLGDAEGRLAPAPIPMFAGRGDRIELLACGSHHTCIVCDGLVFTTGWNRYGQLGVGDDADRSEPAEVVFFRGKRVKDICCGVQHTLVLCDDGLYVMGGNTFGQLGLGHQMNRYTPEKLSFFDSHVVRGMSAWFHSLVSCDDGIFAFGEAQHWKLGTDPHVKDVPQDVLSPTLVEYFRGKDVLSVSAGSEHSAVLCPEGLYLWGNGDGGKLGHGHSDPVTDPAFSLLPSLQSYQVHLVALGVDHTLVYATPR